MTTQASVAAPASAQPQIYSASSQWSPPTATEVMEANAGGDMGERGGEKKVWGYKFRAMYVIGGIIVFIAVWILLFTGKFNFVTDLADDQRVINTRKLLIWTIIIGAIIDIFLFAGIAMYKRRKA
jgi:heme/copper-type cytochrome/quinol oxidase subunit 2